MYKRKCTSFRVDGVKCDDDNDDLLSGATFGLTQHFPLNGLYFPPEQAMITH